MWSGLSAGRIWLCTQPTDMRCARAPAERLSVRWPAQYRRRRRRRRSRPKAAPVAASRRTRRPNPGTQRRTAGFTSWIQTPGSVARLRRRTCTTYPGKRETRGDDELLCLATDPHSPVATPAKCLRTRHAGSLALPVPHSSSLDFTAERNQTKGRSREIHWFGVDGGTCGPDFTDAVRPDRRQPSRLRRRSGVDDVVDPNSLRDDRGAGVARRRGARTARCFPRCFRRTRRVRLRRRSRSGSASRRRARCPIRHSYYPSCCLCEHRRLLGPCHVSDSLRWCRCAERRA